MPQNITHRDAMRFSGKLFGQSEMDKRLNNNDLWGRKNFASSAGWVSRGGHPARPTPRSGVGPLDGVTHPARVPSGRGRKSFCVPTNH